MKLSRNPIIHQRNININNYFLILVLVFTCESRDGRTLRTNQRTRIREMPIKVNEKVIGKEE